MIAEYKNKKLCDYVKPGRRYLIRFGHGLGDTIMFLPAFEKLKSDFPDATFHLYLESGQELEWVSHKDDGHYDEIFHLDFPMSEGERGITKMIKCCRDELGIDPPFADVVSLSKKQNPFVSVHFQGTALPGSVNCPEEIAAQIWEEIVDAGKVPIECHFEHPFHNPVNRKYEFIHRTVRDVPAKISTLIGMIQHCFAFVGVASGPFVAALSCMPHRTLFLEKKHKVNSYTRNRIAVVELNDYRPGSVCSWLKTL